MWTASEALFYGGLLAMGAAAICGVAAIVIFRVSGKHIQKQLEAEFGKKRR